MSKEMISEIQGWAREELKQSLEFWLEYGLDREHGGFYTCLTRDGKIYATDKSVWMQGRAAWTFSYLCHIYGKKPEWMEAAKSALDFLEAYCINRDAGNRMYFTVTEDGRPLRQRRYNFSEGFYVIGNAEYYGLTGEQVYLDRARAAYQLVYDLNSGMEDPTGMGSKVIAETRQSRGLGDAMIFLNTTNILRRVDSERKELYDRNAQECLDKIFNYHHKPELGCTLETVGINGEFQKDTTAGRVVNPGHAIETAWFVLEEANYLQDQELAEQAAEVYDFAMEKGWDSEYGGLLYFVDCLGYPPESYEHDMKLWWPHTEALIASLMLYRDTKNPRYLQDLENIYTYCKEHFCDPEYGEWFGYLRRDGKPTEPAAKGSTFKGPFHVQRGLIFVDQLANQVLAE